MPGVAWSEGGGVIEWEHPFAVMRDAPEHDPPAIVARLAPSAGATDPLLVARVTAVHRRLVAAAVPHVLPILAVEHDDDRVRVVHRRVLAQPLTTVLRKGPLPVPRVLEILRRACASLRAAQRLGVDHRALGPASILLGEHELWIADYGIADLLARDSTALALVPITPEQITGGATATSEDVYLLGCLAHWMVYGTPVFQADDLATLRRRHAIEDPPRIEQPGLPIALRDAIARALEKDPDDRFADFAAFDEALARAEREAGLPDSAVASLPPPLPVASRRRSIHPMVWTGLGALAVGLALMVSASREAQRDADTPPPLVISASVMPELELPPVPGPVPPPAPPPIAFTAPAIAIAAPPMVPSDEIVVEQETAERVHGRLHDASTDRCEAVRREASEAREAHDWRSLLRATAQKQCWHSRRASTKLRIKALLELKEFDACAAAAARTGTDDPELARWGELCRRRTMVTG